MRYLVQWSIDIEADNAKEAAEKAREIQMNPESIATVFSVTNQHNGKISNVDLLE